MSKDRRSTSQVLARILFLGYAALMIWLLFGQRMDGAEEGVRNVNFIPLYTLRQYLKMLLSSDRAYLVRHAFINLAGNVVMFVPLGILLPGIWKSVRAFWKTMLWAVLTVAAVEASQYATALGSCDIDDLILNIIGAAIGWCLWKLFTKNHR